MMHKYKNLLKRAKKDLSQQLIDHISKKNNCIVISSVKMGRLYIRRCGRGYEKDIKRKMYIF